MQNKTKQTWKSPAIGKEHNNRQMYENSLLLIGRRDTRKTQRQFPALFARECVKVNLNCYYDFVTDEGEVVLVKT